MRYHLILIIIFHITILTSSCSQEKPPVFVEYEQIKTGTQNLISEKLNHVHGKKVGIVANQASLVHRTHLVDTLIAHSINIIRIFSPEHGFRGKAEAGATVKNGIDTNTGLEVVSLYGSHKKPTAEDLRDIDVVLFDLQDVGVRFYTYISTLTYVMEACAENNIPLIVLDRPNPNGFYVDGPVLDTAFSSFVGMHPVPVIYGMTIGEYARMVNGEYWLNDSMQCNLSIISLTGYSHQLTFELPVKPSPNLPNWQSIYLYPSLCLFEGTIVSEGRGTDYPFQVFGHPDYHWGNFTFTPKSISGVSNNPKFKDILCYGEILKGYANNFASNNHHFNLFWLINTYKVLSKKHDFFIPYFDLLAGTDNLREQIETEINEEEIRKSWEEDLEQFKKIRGKYLIYD